MTLDKQSTTCNADSVVTSSRDIKVPGLDSIPDAIYRVNYNALAVREQVIGSQEQSPDEQMGNVQEVCSREPGVRIRAGIRRQS